MESAPEYDSAIALEIIQKKQIVDEETLEKELLDENSDLDTVNIKELKRSNRSDYYLVDTEEEYKELKRALKHVYEGNAVHYIKRIKKTY